MIVIVPFFSFQYVMHMEQLGRRASRKLRVSLYIAIINYDAIINLTNAPTTVLKIAAKVSA